MLVKLVLALLQPGDYASVGLKPSCTAAEQVFLWTAKPEPQTTTNTEHIRTLRTPSCHSASHNSSRTKLSGSHEARLAYGRVYRHARQPAEQLAHKQLPTVAAEPSSQFP